MKSGTSLKSKFILTICLGLLSNIAFSQNSSDDCSGSIESALNLYEEGKLNECINLLKPCLSDLPQDRVFEAHRLMALAYLNLHDDKNVNLAIIELLKSKPDYRQFPEFDPVDFSRLLDKYEVYPKWELGLIVGANSTLASPIENYSVAPSDATFVSKTGYQFGLVGEYFIDKHKSLQSGLQWQGLGYGRDADNVTGWKQEYSERLRFIHIPIVMRYAFIPNMAGWQLSGDLGFGAQFLVATRSVVFLENLSGSNQRIQRSTDQSTTRNKFLASGLIGLSAKRPFASGLVGIEVRSAFGFSNMVKSEMRWDNLEFITANNYVDSDQRLRTMFVSMTYQRPLRGSYVVRLR